MVSLGFVSGNSLPVLLCFDRLADAEAPRAVQLLEVEIDDDSFQQLCLVSAGRLRRLPRSPDAVAFPCPRV
jgi:hypothetical protein